MTNVENLILEHLKQFQAGQDRIERKMQDLVRRISNLEAWQASIIQHLGTLAAADAQAGLSRQLQCTARTHRTAAGTRRLRNL